MGTSTLLLGLDALGPDMLDRMIERGVAPTLAALRDQSRRVAVENYPGMGEGVFWPSAATGLGPAGHGRYFFQQFDPDDYEVRIRDDADAFDAASFWKRLDAAGLKVAVLDWPRTPLEDLDRGFILDNWLGHDPVGPLRSRPPQVADRAARDIGVDPWGGGACSWRLESADEIARFVAGGLERIRMKARFCEMELSAGAFDFFAPVFSEPHDFGHYLWHVTDPDHPRHDRAVARAVGDPFLKMGAALDAAGARIIAAAGKGARILVLAGPGMAPMMSATPAMEAITRHLDLGLEKKPDAIERLRAMYRRLVPHRFRGRASPLVRLALRPALHAEMAGRRFFAVPHNAHAGCIRINLKGRERYGVVEPGRDYETLIADLTRDLSEIRDAETGEPVVECVARTRGVYEGPHLDALPDLFVIWRRDFYFSRVRSEKIGLVDIAPHPRTGDHVWDGLFWMHGCADPRLERGALAPHALAPIIVDAVLGAPATARVPAPTYN